VLMRNQYDHGRIAKQWFANGMEYLYSYQPGEHDTMRSATVHTPEGAIFDVAIDEDGSATVRERATPQAGTALAQ
jgi:hypothetical protein